mmetsp:Transcript_22152/g.87884  ORF Transcript_22152/g.87884 Transcript_22152/m.87884 type:complete len:253 (-) Transcript_22152:376-1134(-)
MIPTPRPKRPRPSSRRRRCETPSRRASIGRRSNNSRRLVLLQLTRRLLRLMTRLLLRLGLRPRRRLGGRRNRRRRARARASASSSSITRTRSSTRSRITYDRRAPTSKFADLAPPRASRCAPSRGTSSCCRRGPADRKTSTSRAPSRWPWRGACLCSASVSGSRAWSSTLVDRSACSTSRSTANPPPSTPPSRSSSTGCPRRSTSRATTRSSARTCRPTCGRRHFRGTTASSWRSSTRRCPWRPSSSTPSRS